MIKVTYKDLEITAVNTFKNHSNMNIIQRGIESEI